MCYILWTLLAIFVQNNRCDLLGVDTNLIIQISLLALEIFAMKILAVSDEDFDGSFKLPDDTGDIIIGCGDLSLATIDKILGQTSNPFFGVAGNHDSFELSSEINLHLCVKEHQGLSFGGFEGAIKYKPKGFHLYREEQVTSLLENFPYVDVFVAHSSPKGIHDRPDVVHEGLSAFNDYIKKHQPILFVHGHVHHNQITKVGKTTVVSVYGSKMLDLR